MMRVLLVEDDRRITSDVTRTLAASGFVVETVSDGEEAWFRGDTEDYGAVILDLGLPRMDGLSVLKRWRANGRRMPVLILSARGTWAERVDGIDAGADDYLPKPFAFAELIARLRALARRPAPGEEGRLTAGDLELDEQRHVARVGDRSVDLSAREFALLGFLMHHADQVMTRQQILDGVWGAEPDVYSNVVDLYVHYLRRKLTELAQDGRLRTVRGVGYVLRNGA